MIHGIGIARQKLAVPRVALQRGVPGRLRAGLPRRATTSSIQRGGEPMAKILESLQNTVIAGIVLTVIVAIILVAI